MSHLPMRTAVFLAACAIAVIIGVTPVLVYGLPVSAIGFFSDRWWGLCAFGLGLLAPFAAGFGIALGFPLTVVLLEGLSGFGNLGPIAAAVTLMQSGVPAAIGATLGAVSRHVPARLCTMWGCHTPSAAVMCGASTLIVILSIVLAFSAAHLEAEAIVARASHAKSKLKVLWRAQRAFNLREGIYACTLGELDVPFEGGTREHAVYSWGFERDYQFTLYCQQRKPVIRSPFYIDAQPRRYSGTYARMARWRYCVDEGGDLRAVGVDERRRCLDSGDTVSRLSDSED